MMLSMAVKSRVYDSQYYTVFLDKPVEYKVFSQPDKVLFKKIKKSVLNTITFYLEDDNNEEVNFNVETLTFTLHMIKI